MLTAQTALPILIFYSHFVAITFIANTDKEGKKRRLVERDEGDARD